MTGTTKDGGCEIDSLLKTRCRHGMSIQYCANCMAYAREVIESFLTRIIGDRKSKIENEDLAELAGAIARRATLQPTC